MKAKRFKNDLGQTEQQCKWRPPRRSTCILPRRSVMSYGVNVDAKCNFTDARQKSAAFPAPVFKQLANAEQ